MTATDTSFEIVPAPDPRLDVVGEARDAARGVLAIGRAVRASDLDPRLCELIKIRASQINGCAYCLDMHVKDARAAGEAEDRIYWLSAWHEAPCYSASERAALALVEAITRIADGGVPDDVYAVAARHFDRGRLAHLIMLIVEINAWNRITITARSPQPGSYDPADREG